MSKIGEIENLTEKDLELKFTKYKDMKHVSVRMPKDIVDYVNELKKTRKIASKTQFYNERLIEGLKTNNILIRTSPMHRVDIRVPERLLNFISSNKLRYRGELARNCILLGIEEYRTNNLKEYQDNIEASKKQKSIKKTYTVEMTIAKVLDFLEWVWDSESEGHYRPIIASCLETINYKTTLTLLNNILKETLVGSVVITKLKITPN